MATVYAIKLRNNIFLATWTIHSLIPFLSCRTEIDPDQLPNRISVVFSMCALRDVREVISEFVFLDDEKMIAVCLD
jgi:hypothetical protein